MSVDCKVTLPPGCRVRDVANVIGLAAGLPGELKTFPSGSGIYLDVAGVTTEPSPMPECAWMLLDATPAAPSPAPIPARVLYHHEWDTDETPGCTGFMVRSLPFWCAVARKVVECFGGTVDYNDCDTTTIDAAYLPSVRPASDGQAWDDYQRGMAEVTPVTQDDLDAVLGSAAYA